MRRPTSGLRRIGGDVLDTELLQGAPNWVSTVFDTRLPAAADAK
jgi:hypothetical protein